MSDHVTPALTAERLSSLVAELPRWRVRNNVGESFVTPDGWAGPDEATLLLDRGDPAALVWLRPSGDPRWRATYYASHSDFRRGGTRATNPDYDDGIYSEMLEIGRTDPVGFPLDLDDPAGSLRRIEQARDEDILTRNDTYDLRRYLRPSFVECLRAPGEPWESGGLLNLPADAYVQWTRVGEPGTPLHVEVSDGSEYAAPLPAPFADLLVDLGWQAPDEQLRNAWTWAETDDELDRTVALVIRTLVAAFGLQIWDLHWDRLLAG